MVDSVSTSALRWTGCQNLQLMLRNTLMSSSDTVLLFDAGTGQAQGGRPTQEDRCTFVLPDQFPSRTEDKLAFFAIYDGHGSELVSEHASRNLHLIFAKRPEFDKGDYEGAIKGALTDEDGVLLNNFKTKTNEPAISGSTVAICFVNLTKGEMVVANLGDSHVILAERDPRSDHPYHIHRLTRSHKPDVPSERSRIEDAGGAVNNRTGTARLGSLNMSRAIGDLQYKNPINKVDDDGASKRTRRASGSSDPNLRGDFLSNVPHINRQTLQSDRRYLVAVTSDGVSDTIDDTTLIRKILNLSMRGLRAGDIAQDVANGTARKANSDNGSCIVAMLDGQDS